MAIAPFLNDQLPSNTLTAFLGWLMLCAAVGVGQGLVLRNYFQQIQAWPIATIVSGAIAYVGFFMLFFAPLIIGVIMGLGQWLILINKVKRSWQWFLINVLCGLVGVFLGIVLFNATRNLAAITSEQAFLLMCTGVGFFSSVMTGVVMQRIIEKEGRSPDSVS
jgi:hypothetical protein